MKGEKNNSVTGSGLRKRMLNISLLPVLVLGFIITGFTYWRFSKTMATEVHDNLRNVAMATILGYDGIFPGDYKVNVEGDVGTVFKGDTNIMEEYDYIDSLKAETEMDIILFYKDISFSSTKMLGTGERIKGLVANEKLVNEVVRNKQPMFYDNVEVGQAVYYAYYAPLFNGEECMGMVFVGKPSATVNKKVLKSALPIMGIAVLMMALMVFFCTRLAKELTGVIDKEKAFLGAIAAGNLRADLDAEILARPDELGEMAKFTVRVQKFIRDMIERDPLTKLFTRRIGSTRIDVTLNDFRENNIPFCIAMGDIDFFKKFNDNYGHDCGDLVLSETAGIFNRMMIGNGYAVRWGGEEFVMIFQDMHLDKAAAVLGEIRNEVISQTLNYGGEDLHITMTFGIVEGNGTDIDEQIKAADELLYFGKTHGRNQIVRQDLMAIRADLEADGQLA